MIQIRTKYWAIIFAIGFTTFFGLGFSNPPEKERVQDEVETDKALDALSKCVSKYMDLDQFSIKVEYSVFFNHTNFKEPNDKRYGQIIRDKNNMYQEEMGNIKILNSKYQILINKQAEVLVIADRREQKINPFEFESDSLKPNIHDVKRIKNGYRFRILRGELLAFDLILDEEGFLKIWRSFYRQKRDFGKGEVSVITQMRYLDFSKSISGKKVLFDESSYVSISKAGEVSGVGDYKGYHIINQLQQK